MIDGINKETAYLSNLFSLLNLRLFHNLGLCDAETRDAVHDRIVEAAGNPIRDEFPVLEGETEAYQNLMEAFLQENADLLSQAEAENDLPAIEKLRDCFDLSPEELVFLTAILAPVIDERFRRTCRLFQGSEAPRKDFLLSLIDPDGLGRFRNAELLGMYGKLLSRGLVESNEKTAYMTGAALYYPAPGLVEWLNGKISLAAYAGRGEWRDTVTLRKRTEPVFASVASSILRSEENDESVPLISFYGPDGELLLEYAEALAAEMQRPILKLNLSKTEPAESIPLLRIVLRDCVLNHALPVLFGMEGWTDSGGILPAELGSFFAEWNVPVILLSDRQLVFSLKELSKERLILRVPVQRLTGAQRFVVWKRYLEGLPMAAGADDASLRTLAGQFTLTTAQIRSAVNAGLEIAVTDERELSMKDLYEGARLSSMHHLSDLAKKMEARYTINDLILPEKQKQEIDELISMAKNRSHVLEDLGVGKKLVSGRGISALFTGVPGTGKTLSAQVIASELGLDLYRIDLSTIVSKYIGETEKNLERIFTEAQSSNVILFFDEADSLFGRRSEVNDSHDRYANIEVGYLLQRIETYDGIVLMATNLGANLDEAFARRINFIIDFPFPDEETRLRLWKLLIPDNIEKEDDFDLEIFAAIYKIAGGNIRNAVVSAIYDSARNKRPLCGDDLRRGVEREYQKMGKVFPTYR